MSNYAMTSVSAGPLTLKIYPVFEQPEGAIVWSGEVTLSGSTLLHVTRQRSEIYLRALESS